MNKSTIIAMTDELTKEQEALFAKDTLRIDKMLEAEERGNWKGVDQFLDERRKEPDSIKGLRTKEYKNLLNAWEKESRREIRLANKQKEQIMTEADRNKLDRVNRLINERAEVQEDGTIRVKDWAGINRELKEANREKNKMFEDAIRSIAEEDKAAMQKPSESPPLERRNINSKETNMSDQVEETLETGEKAADPNQQTFNLIIHQRKVITDAMKEGTLCCLPGPDGYADTNPAVNLVNGTNYHGTNLLFLKADSNAKGFPTAEYATFDQIKAAGLFVREGEKGVSLSVSEKIADDKYETKNIRLFNIAQTNKPWEMKEYAENKQQEDREKYLAFLHKNYGDNYQPPEKKEKGPGPEIVCSSTEPKEYLGQYLAAVSTGGKFKASPEQAKEFCEKYENRIYKKLENGHTNPWEMSKLSNEASRHCKEEMAKIGMESRRQSQEQQQTQERSRGGISR